MTDLSKGRAGRPPKAEIIEGERRRRKGAIGRHAARLDVPQEILDNHPDFVFRWINDSGTRLNEMITNDDWDIVDNLGNPKTSDLGSALTRVVGTDPRTGQPALAYLARKPRQFAEEDARAKEAYLKTKENALRNHADANVPNSYIPGVGNTIESKLS